MSVILSNLQNGGLDYDKASSSLKDAVKNSNAKSQEKMITTFQKNFKHIKIDKQRLQEVK